MNTEIVKLNSVCVDREQFISYTEGILLKFENGTGFAVNEKLCQEAENCLLKGSTVFLTEDGHIISKLEYDGESFIEKSLI